MFKLRFALLLFLGLLTSGTAMAEEAQWIWGTAKAAVDAPVGSCHFRKTIEVEKVESALIDVICDDRYVLRINGRLVGASNNRQRLDRYEVAPLLVKGSNMIDIHCVNDGGSAGMAARVTVQSSEGKSVSYSTDKSWKVYLQAGASWDPAAFNRAKPTPTIVLGPLGSTEPWGDQFTTSPLVSVGKPRSRKAPAGPLELKDGDRVVLLGNTIVERAQLYGYLETALTARFHKQHVVFRNLGWSGDTVEGHSRARFGRVKDGFEHLAQHVYAEKPTVLIIAYGANAAHEGQKGLPAFLDGLAKLLDVVEGTGARITLVSPVEQEDLGPPLPNPSEHNKNVRIYRDAMRDVASERAHRFVDMVDLLASRDAEDHLTDNGIHLTDYGYWRAAPIQERGLGLRSIPWNVLVDTSARKQATSGTKLVDLKVSADGVSFLATDETLPLSPPADAPAKALRFATPRKLTIAGLKPGKYQLKIDGKTVASADHRDWSQGVAITQGPQFTQAEKLRQEIIAKNQLYFHRWRPQNETYLYLFRKHEQGNNAREIPQFDPLVGKSEHRIALLRTPAQHKYQLTRVGD